MFRQHTWRTDGPAQKLAPAIGAYIAKPRLGAVLAEGTFIRAGARGLATGRKIGIAALAVWFQDQHDEGSSCSGIRVLGRWGLDYIKSAWHK